MVWVMGGGNLPAPGGRWNRRRRGGQKGVAGRTWLVGSLHPGSAPATGGGQEKRLPRPASVGAAGGAATADAGNVPVQVTFPAQGIT
ncbi:hypothetical protein GCM10008937_19310 [Deinococcus depolymerans]|uniref:Uncharacterized protein n=1 Tax=Deinococcus depolymerans TaxID=392408 RepID=A0ABN1C4F5_9DEIO